MASFFVHTLSIVLGRRVQCNEQAKNVRANFYSLNRLQLPKRYFKTIVIVTIVLVWLVPCHVASRSVIKKLHLEVGNDATLVKVDTETPIFRLGKKCTEWHHRFSIGHDSKMELVGIHLHEWMVPDVSPDRTLYLH